MMNEDTQGTAVCFAPYQHLLCKRLQNFLDTLHPALRADVTSALEAEGKLLALSTPVATNRTLPAGVWPLLTFLVAQHVAPNIDPLLAGNVAIAMECLACAFDLQDDIEDEDRTPVVEALGSARVVNISTTLLALAQQAILALSQQGVADSLVLRLLAALQEATLAVTLGQQRDILAEQRPAQDFTLEECLEIAEQKAGSLFRIACVLGALCAGADDDLCTQFAELGRVLGIAHQLDNDCHDLYYIKEDESSFSPTEAEASARSVKTDLVRGKKTLPVVLAAKSPETLQHTSFSPGDATHLPGLHEGIIAAWGICLLYRERAREQLRKIEARHPISPALRSLLGFS
jgi:geranylgeranyl pyrophosphate synthase